jgi:hypothetical protein
MEFMRFYSAFSKGLILGQRSGCTSAPIDITISNHVLLSCITPLLKLSSSYLDLTNLRYMKEVSGSAENSIHRPSHDLVLVVTK